MKHQVILAAVAALVGTNAYAGGFEKNVTWSGKYVGIGGAAVSAVEGSESLYFNPSGLAVKRGANGDVTLNFSPTFAKYKGPFNATTRVQEETDKSFIPVGGLTASYELMERLSVGVGYYVSGGTNAVYENVNVGFPTFTPEIKSELALTEASVGLGYEVLPGLRIGAAWRVLMVNGDFFFPRPAASDYVKIEDIKKTKYNGFKLGAQYEGADKRWAVGATFRNGVNFAADMKQTVFNALGTAGTPATGTISSSFPWQAAIGGNYGITDDLWIHLEFVHTDYNHNGAIDITNGTAPFQLVTTWKDQQNYRLGFEYKGIENLPLRAGYVYTTQVVPDARANATFSSPGVGHTVALGAGRSFLENNALDINVAAEHSWAKGDVAGVTTAVPGEYSSSSWAAHLGAAYKF